MNINDQISAAIGAHGLWKGRLRTAIEKGVSETPVNVVRDDRQCNFGKWLHGPELDATAKKSAHYGACVEIHRRFHSAAADVLQLAMSGKKDEASRLLAPDQPFGKISSELTREMLAWKGK
jgi:methyl-accepting chemotaxis protein